VTDLEYSLLKLMIPESEQLNIFSGLKEAYLYQSLCLGSGLNFKRIESDVVERIVQVDENVPEDWRFNNFVNEDSKGRSGSYTRKC
jgi:hypothetical protein